MAARLYHASELADMTPQQAGKILNKASTAQRDFLCSWPGWQRPDQAFPDGDWRIWLVLAGRGYGKTRMGAEWVRAMARSHPGCRIALVAGTMAEARSIMVEGESGLLSLPGTDRPDYAASLGRLVWENGAQAFLYSAAEAEGLRGPQHEFAWADEIAKWPDGPRCWDNLQFGLRLGAKPRCMATTTPRPVPLLRRILREGGLTVTRGRTRDNSDNLPAAYLAAMQAQYGGTRLGRQELEGELIEELEGALWSRELVERCHADRLPEMARIVVGVDPPAGSVTGPRTDKFGDECGIIVCGLGADAKGYVLADCSVAGASPEGWARAVANAADAWHADRVIAEANQGGRMVESTLRAASVGLPVKLVHASRGKAARAEPVAALFEAGRACFGGAFPALEDQLCGLIAGGGYEGPGRSPDRADACVWAMTELMLGRGAGRAEG